ncbi:MAG: hypothetical protein K6U74_02455 [Firmicutes bacterium]|nr:hypothetical protein [Bacillota bacterium]
MANNRKTVDEITQELVSLARPTYRSDGTVMDRELFYSEVNRFVERYIPKKDRTSVFLQVCRLLEKHGVRVHS